MRLLYAFLLGLNLALVTPALSLAQTALIDKKPWVAAAADGVIARQTTGENGARLDYDFQSGGYAVITHDAPFKPTANFEVRFKLRGQGDLNDIQFKFTDAKNENVWWAQKPSFKPTIDGTIITIRPRHISFAWGPTQDKNFRESARFELVVSKTLKGAKTGWLDISDISWVALPDIPKTPPKMRANHPEIIDDQIKTIWAAQADDIAVIDLGMVRDFGGLRLDWVGPAPQSYQISLAHDAKQFDPSQSISHSDGGVDIVPLGDVSARYIRIATKSPARLSGVSLLGLEIGTDANAAMLERARLAPKGVYPRAFSGQQSYWTIIGVKGGGARAMLMSEDGAIELGPQGPSLEPFIVTDGQRIDWSNAQIKRELSEDGSPLAEVKWGYKDIHMTIKPVAIGSGQNPYGFIQYAITNHGQTPRNLGFVLAIRPFQVNPPSQFLNRKGGISPIKRLVLGYDRAQINDKTGLVLYDTPSSYDVGTVLTGAPFIASGATSIQDEDGLATGAYRFDMMLEPGETRLIKMSAPLGDDDSVLSLEQAKRNEALVRAQWREDLGRTTLSLPKGTPPIAQSLRQALAHMLMLKDKDLLKPGARSYDRSWIRDGAMMSEGLMRLGHFDEAQAYFEAYAPYIYPSGKVPCCVDDLGAGPVPEHDSNGEFVWLASELLRYGYAPERLRPHFNQIKSVMAYQTAQIETERGAQNLSPDRRHLYGLLPPSISHEGYSDKPAYSYWDDFWGLKGYRGASQIAKALGDEPMAAQWQQDADRFAKDIYDSIEATGRFHRIDYVAGSADRGDFDPTSTTIGMTAGALGSDIPYERLKTTFERYYQKTLLPRMKQPNLYTPYELRSVAAFVRLRAPDKALKALDLFFSDQTPSEWYQWAEVITVPRRKVQFLGDLPHGWVASDYIRSALDLFAYERIEAHQMVLLGGFDPAWADKGETHLNGLFTPYGRLSLRVSKHGKNLIVDIDADKVPPGGFVIDVESLFRHQSVVVTLQSERQAVTPVGEVIVTEPKARIIFHPQGSVAQPRSKSKPKPKRHSIHSTPKAKE